MNILVIGANGQLGTDMFPALRRRIGRDDGILGVTRDTVDVCNRDQVRHALDTLRPSVVVNTAAFHNVEQCEDEPAEAMLVNGTAVGELARECSRRGMKLVHLSTDFVFGGDKRTPYVETDAPDPLSAYARSKLEGERQVQAAGPEHLIVRTCGLFGHAGSKTRHGNFVEKMLKAANAGQELRVVSDKIATPTATVDLASAMAELIARNASGIYHVTNEGECSWHEYAQEAVRLSGSPAIVKSVTSAEFKTKAQRPAYSVLSKAKLYALGIPKMPRWRDALQRYIATRPLQ